MELEVARQVVAVLRGGVLRSRTAILLLAPSVVGREREVAARLQVDAVTYVDLLLSSAPAGARTLGIAVDREERRLDAVASCEQGADVVLVADFDVALARLTSSERERLWSDLYAHFGHRRRALLLGVPQAARDLQPCEAALADWRRGSRVASLQAARSPGQGDERTC